jgi:pyruvate,water dikinase
MTGSAHEPAGRSDRAGSGTDGADRPLVLPFARLDRGALELAGGKAANLGEMLRAGLPVPPGFCVTTAAYGVVAAGADLEPELAGLESAGPDDRACLDALAASARAKLVGAAVPARLEEAILAAYRVLGDGVPVAVRSSATAEDLPTASFAGQQDTYLNVVGSVPLLDAVRRCWASLWTERAVAYRASNGVDHRSVRLAVAVQPMVEAEVAGVLFTADPLTGRRHRAVIDASPGLGEAIVAGAVNPDHFAVDVTTGRVLERRLGDKRIAIRAAAGGGTERVELGDNAGACLSDEQLRELARLGARVEAHYGAPQDTEFAIDRAGRIWLLQARPITTLFPLPAGAPAADDDLRVYFSVNVAQGVFRPITPMGQQAFRLFGTAAATLLGRPPRDRYAGPAALQEAAGRLYVDVTPLLRSTLGRRVALFVGQHMEARTAAVLRALPEDPRLAPRPTPPWRVARHLLPALIRTAMPLRLAEALVSPPAARARIARTAAAALAAADLPAGADAAAALAAAERALLRTMPLVPRLASVFAAGLVAQRLAGLLLGDRATDQERQAVLRALPHNPTTEMDLALWALAQRLRADVEASRALRELPPERLAGMHAAGALPASLGRGLGEFLRVYGHRGVAEIDLGLPRWSEDPTHILGVLANYLRLDDPARAPDAQFRRGAAAAEAARRELTDRARRRGRLRGVLVGFLLGRVRALAGTREAPKFHAVAVLARARERLRAVGEELAGAGRLERPEDVFFVDLPEARRGLAGADLRALVRERRAAYERELRRRHVPRLLLSDGTEPTAAGAVGDEGALRGTPASAGVATGAARVVLDPTGARLDPGEILVAPSTDPGWTPLFLTAGGLVMEMGGAMSHGAVVAREYGIPAVVGVAGATEHLRTGQRVVVDGGAGLVRIDAEA